MSERLVSYSEIDSRRFGKNIFRARARGVIDVAAIDDIGQSERADLMIARCGTDAPDVVHALESAGYLLMDTLVYYAGHPRESTVNNSPHVIRFASLEDRDILGLIASDCFTGYLGHYHADPRLDPSTSTLGYVDWCVSSIGAAGHRVWVAVEEENVTGFIVLRQGEPTSIPEIALNGVASRYRRRGVYDALFKTAASALAREGESLMSVSTQLHNFAPQRTWVRNGLFLQSTVHTFHKWF
jgi:hypothetical protein